MLTDEHLYLVRDVVGKCLFRHIIYQHVLHNQRLLHDRRYHQPADTRQYQCHRKDGGNDSQHTVVHLTTVLEELHQWE